MALLVGRHASHGYMLKTGAASDLHLGDITSPSVQEHALQRCSLGNGQHVLKAGNFHLGMTSRHHLYKSMLCKSAAGVTGNMLKTGTASDFHLHHLYKRSVQEKSSSPIQEHSLQRCSWRPTVLNTWPIRGSI